MKIITKISFFLLQRYVIKTIKFWVILALFSIRKIISIQNGQKMAFFQRLHHVGKGGEEMEGSRAQTPLHPFNWLPVGHLYRNTSRILEYLQIYGTEHNKIYLEGLNNTLWAGNHSLRLCSHQYQGSIQFLIRSKEYTINSISINMAAQFVIQNIPSRRSSTPVLSSYIIAKGFIKPISHWLQTHLKHSTTQVPLWKKRLAAPITY